LGLLVTPEFVFAALPSTSQASAQPMLGSKLASSWQPAPAVSDVQYDYLSELSFNGVVNSLGSARDEQNSRTLKSTGSTQFGQVLEQFDGAFDPLSELGGG
jgi:hypothetical protein